MPKGILDRPGQGQRGLTLVEVMVSSGLVGIIFLAIMTLLGQVGKFSSSFNNEFVTIEGVTEAVGLLNGIVPQTTRIKTCNCQANTSARANCIWDSSNPWYDPVSAGGAASPVTIFSGEFEAFEGTQALTSMSALATNAISISGQTCQSQVSDMASSLQRGCKFNYSLVYTAPTLEAGTTPSNAGMLTLNTGSSRLVKIGLNTTNGGGNLGLSRLSCGFDNSSGGVVGSTFVLNMRIKAKSNLIQLVSNSNYESWHPSGKNYAKGSFRDVQLKFSMRNISIRGVYFWRPQSIRDCKPNGSAAGNAAQCCSQAYNGTSCIACIRSGQASTGAAACCSGRLNVGNCQ